MPTNLLYLSGDKVISLIFNEPRAPTNFQKAKINEEYRQRLHVSST